MTTLKILNFTKIRKQVCPACGLPLNASSDQLNDNSPGPGDITLCAGCKTVLKFEDAMDLRMATQSEINEVEVELGQSIKSLLQNAYSLLKTPEGLAILCHDCGKTSINTNDIDNRYCGYCHRFLDDNFFGEKK